MGDRLKPCPFCGGEAHCEKSLRWHIGECWRVGCDTKGCIGWILLESVLYLSEQIAVDKWNTRANPTCCIENIYYDELWFATCTELSCGHDVWGEVLNYCPVCGAKVIESRERKES